MKKKQFVTLATACIAIAVSLASCSSAEVESNDTIPPPDTGLSLAKIATLVQPVDATSRDNDQAIYFVERLGKIYRYSNNAMGSDPVLDITDLSIGEG